jgi:hypothetical protein
MTGENDSTTFVPIPPQVAAKFPDLVANTPPGFVAPTFVGEPLPSEPATTGAGDPGGYGAPVTIDPVTAQPSALAPDPSALNPTGVPAGGDPGVQQQPPLVLQEVIFTTTPRDDTIVGAGAISEDLFGQPSDAALDTGDAIRALKAGGRIARAGWNGQYLEIEHGSVLWHDGGARGLFGVFSDDLLATDWRIVS